MVGRITINVGHLWSWVVAAMLVSGQGCCAAMVDAQGYDRSAPRPDHGDGFFVAGDVEPHVIAAWHGAIARLPQVHRELLKEVTLRRESHLHVPGDFPLEYRLMASAAHASYGIAEREVVVYDAGVSGRSKWREPPPSADDVVAFLAAIADALGVAPPQTPNDPGSQLAWEQFTQRVYAWSGDASPQPTPPLGDVAVLEQFMNAGVDRALGGVPDIEQLLLHELAHGIQLAIHAPLFRKIHEWSWLSDWRETYDGSVTDGILGGGNRMEDPLALVRLLFDAPRGDTLLYPTKTDVFVNRYMEYDPREDYAEATRLFVYAPHMLAEISPEKLLYLNAASWNATAELTDPPSLWFDAQQLHGAPWRDRLVQAANWYLAGGDALAQPTPQTIAAVLAAHAEVFSADELLPPHELPEIPYDLPAAVLAWPPLNQLAVMIDNVTFVPPPSLIVSQWDRLYEKWAEQQAGVRTLEPLLHDAQSLRLHLAEVTAIVEDHQARYESLGLYLRLGSQFLDREEFVQAVKREIDHHHQHGVMLFAFLIALHPNVQLADEADIAAAKALVRRLPASFDAAELAALIVRHHLRQGEVDEALEHTAAIQGNTHAARLRIELLSQIASDYPHHAEQAQHLAESLLSTIALPWLRERLAETVQAMSELVAAE